VCFPEGAFGGLGLELRNWLQFLVHTVLSLSGACPAQISPGSAWCGRAA
jgi:hypothetical protein